MSQAPDPAGGSSELQSSQQSSPQFPDGAPAPSAPAVDEPYKALSITALIGFILTIAYVLIVTISVLAGLFSGTPTLIATWTLVFPIIAIALCVLARLQISRSEGTLAGQKIAGWGIVLCLFIAMGLVGYRVAIHLAIRQQARAFTEEWFGLMKEGEVYRAARRLLPPVKQSEITDEEEDLKTELEAHLGIQDGPQGPTSQLRTFLNATYVQLIKAGGKSTKIEFRGVKHLEHKRIGYEVELLFTVETAYQMFNISVMVEGMTAPSKEYAGRRWRVDQSRTTLDESLGAPRTTPLGIALFQIETGARAFFDQWKKDLASSERFLHSYIGTLSPDQREKTLALLQPQRTAGAIGGGTSVLAVGSELKLDDPKSLKGYKEYLNAKILNLAKLQMVEPKAKSTVLQAVKATFSSEGDAIPSGMSLQDLRPDWKHANGEIEMRFPLQWMSPPEWGVRGYVVLKGSLKEMSSDAPPPDWWISEIILSEGRMMQESQPPPPPPGDVPPPGN